MVRICILQSMPIRQSTETGFYSILIMKKRLQKKNLKTVVLLLLLCSVTGLLCACAQKRGSSDSASSIASELTFTDANGNSHTFTVDEEAAFHDYDTGLFSTDGQFMTYSDSEAYSYSCGIDVSYYQGTIDWTQVKDAGFDFAFIRIGYRGYGTDGTLNEDERFAENLAGARSAGLDVGVYFYAQAISEEEAAEEAAFVLDLLDGVSLTLPVIYDPEYVLDEDGNKLSQARTSAIDGDQISQNTLTFCSAIENAGYETGFYANMLFEALVLDMAALSEYTVWYADYADTPQTPYAFSYWQYSDSGKIDGIEGSVDLNIRLF